MNKGLAQQVRNFAALIRRDGAVMTVRVAGGVHVETNVLDVLPQHVHVHELGVRASNRLVKVGSWDAYLQTQPRDKRYQ